VVPEPEPEVVPEPEPEAVELPVPEPLPDDDVVALAVAENGGVGVATALTGEGSMNVVVPFTEGEFDGMVDTVAQEEAVLLLRALAVALTVEGALGIALAVALAVGVAVMLPHASDALRSSRRRTKARDRIARRWCGNVPQQPTF
jgi:hypothetical protein